MPELVPAVPLTPGWHAARRGGVTATDIVTILGLSSWDSVYSLFWRKMQQAPEVEDNDRMALGKALEDYIITRWANTGTNWKDFIRWPSCLYRHPERTWQMATPDRVLVKENVLDAVGVLEVKTWADADKHAWQDGPPARVRAQVLWQMDVMDVGVGHVGVVFLPSGEFRSYTIEHDGTAYSAEVGTHGDFDELQACTACKDIDLMRDAGSEFMARLRLELPPPDPDSSAATLAAVRARFTRQPGKQADVDRSLYLDWVAYDMAVKGAEEQKRRIEILLREQAGEASVLCVDGQPVARRIISDAQVKAHTRHQDYLKRINQGDDDA